MEFHLSNEDISYLEDKLCELAGTYSKYGYDAEPSDVFDEVIDHIDNQINEF